MSAGRSFIRGGRRRTTRVCVVGSSQHFLSGISYYTCRLSNALEASGFEVSAVLMRRLLPKHFYPGRTRVGDHLSELRYAPDVRVFDGVDWFWLPSIFRALWFVALERPDEFIFEWWTSTVLHTYLVLAAVARVMGARVVLEFHETLDTAEAQRLLPRLYASVAIRPLLKMVHGFAVHSEFDRNAVAQRYPLGRKPIVVVPHGPYDHIHGSISAQALDDGPCRLLYFGTIRPYKGVEYLVEAFDGMDSVEAERHTLTIVGETWEGWELPGRLIASSRYRDRITFVNRYVTDTEAARFFAEADAVVLPYLRSSASGPLHMAMSLGLPVVVTRVGGLTEAGNRYAGTVFAEPADVISLRAAIREVSTMTGTCYPDPCSWADSASTLASLFDGATVPQAVGA